MIKFFVCIMCVSLAPAATVHLSVLSKISAKKTPLVMQGENPVSIHDMILKVDGVRREKDSFDGDVDCVDLTAYLNQEDEAPVLLFQGEIRSSPRYPQTPLDHPLYDIILDYVED